MASGSASPTVAVNEETAGPVAGCPDCVTRRDPVLHVAFPAPRAYFYVPARVAQSTEVVLTETARLSSYSLDVPRPTDLTGELLVELFLAPRKGQDLATIARNRLSASSPRAGRDVTVGGHPVLRVEGDFLNGSRVYVLVAVDDERVVVMGASPRESPRLPDFERIVRFLVFI